MRFNFAVIFALAATTQLTAAAPTKWNDKGPEASYKFGAVACTLGAYVCNQMGQPLGQHVFVGTGVCCSTAAAAVTASQSQGWTNAAKKLGHAAAVASATAVKGGKYAVECGASACKLIAKKIGGRDELESFYDEEDEESKEHLTARFAESDLLLN